MTTKFGGSKTEILLYRTVWNILRYPQLFIRGSWVWQMDGQNGLCPLAISRS